MLINGDVFSVLPTLSLPVQMCVTSPPYWGLRDYGTATWEGGDPACDHSHFLGGNGESSAKQVTSAGTQKYQYRGICGKCSAKRIDNQLGLEATPDEYVAKMVAVFREVKRVLRDDGTLWLNLGDSYAANRSYQVPSTKGGAKHSPAQGFDGSAMRVPTGLKAKDLVGIPWMLAFALRADGWYLRQDIIWAKPNPMPESVRDRCTKSHEYLFLLSKSPKYYFNSDAIKEPCVRPDEGKRKTPAKFGGADKWQEAQKDSRLHSGNEYLGTPDGKRNKRDVWTVATKPYKGAHFATFPPTLIEPCILAGSRPGDTVLDPFGGSGTVGQVAKQHGRDYLLIELNEKYCELAKKRIS